MINDFNAAWAGQRVDKDGSISLHFSKTQKTAELKATSKIDAFKQCLDNKDELGF